MINNFAGIKFTNEDFSDFLSCLNYNDGAYDILWGRDECFLSALVLGCRGAVGSTYNYAAPLYHSLINLFDKGYINEAKKLQQKSIDMVSLLGKYGGIATGKAYMKYIGIDCGKFRLPVKNMTDKMYEDFMKDVKLLKMDKFFSIR
jgi:N-acetylneuraminate lyase